MNLRTNKSGFTLIEILIVTVIIGILATLGIVAYTNSMRNARNAKSIGNLNAMQAAFEQYYTANGVYAAWTTMDDELQGGVRPQPPTGGGAYVYSPATPATTYCICAPLEGGTVRGGNSTNNSCTAYTTTGAGTFYCVQSRQ